MQRLNRSDCAIKPRHIALIMSATCACEVLPASLEHPDQESDQAAQGVYTSQSIFPTGHLTLCGMKDQLFTEGGSDPVVSDAIFKSRMDEIREYLRDWEDVSGIVFDYKPQCAAATGNPSYYSEDIRIAYSGAAPNDPTGNRGVLPAASHLFPWTVHIADAANGTNGKFASLHEVGHALGMADQEERWADYSCAEKPPNPRDKYLTPADQTSIMNYAIGPGNGYCAIKGDSALSDWDRVGMEIAYPKYSDTEQKVDAFTQVAFGGGWVSFPGQPVLPDWRARGALANVFGDFYWLKQVGDQREMTFGLDTLSSSSWAEDVATTISMGFNDPWGRSRAGSITVTPSAAKATSIVMTAVGS